MILFFTVPTEGYIRHEITSFKDAAASMMKSHGDTLIWSPVTDSGSWSRKPTMACRNRTIEDMLNTIATRYLSMDYDCIPFRDEQPDMVGLGYMLDDLERDDVDVVFGWSLIHRPRENDLVPCVLAPQGQPTVHTPNPRPDQWPLDFVSPYSDEPLTELKGGAVGSHCFMVKREVFLAMKAAGRLYFDDVHDRDPDSDRYGGRIQGHDVSFCQLAQDLGFRVWLDNRIFWGHMKDVDLRWIHDLVRGFTRRIDAHQSVALKAYPDSPAWVTLRIAEEEARGKSPQWYSKADPWEAYDGVDVLVFEAHDSPAFKAYFDQLVIKPGEFPLRAEFVGEGVVVTL